MKRLFERIMEPVWRRKVRSDKSRSYRNGRSDFYHAYAAEVKTADCRNCAHFVAPVVLPTKYWWVKDSDKGRCVVFNYKTVDVCREDDGLCGTTGRFLTVSASASATASTPSFKGYRNGCMSDSAESHSYRNGQSDSDEYYASALRWPYNR